MSFVVVAVVVCIHTLKHMYGTLTELIILSIDCLNRFPYIWNKRTTFPLLFDVHKHLLDVKETPCTRIIGFLLFYLYISGSLTPYGSINNYNRGQNTIISDYTYAQIPFIIFAALYLSIFPPVCVPYSFVQAFFWMALFFFSFPLMIFFYFALVFCPSVFLA